MSQDLWRTFFIQHHPAVQRGGAGFIPSSSGIEALRRCAEFQSHLWRLSPRWCAPVLRCGDNCGRTDAIGQPPDALGLMILRLIYKILLFLYFSFPRWWYRQGGQIFLSVWLWLRPLFFSWTRTVRIILLLIDY